MLAGGGLEVQPSSRSMIATEQASERGKGTEHRCFTGKDYSKPAWHGQSAMLSVSLSSVQGALSCHRAFESAQGPLPPAPVTGSHAAQDSPARSQDNRSICLILDDVSRSLSTTSVWEHNVLLRSCAPENVLCRERCFSKLIDSPTVG